MTINPTTASDSKAMIPQASATIYLVSQSVDRLSEGRRLAGSVVATCESDTSKVARGIHPDVIELSPPEGKERIGIGQVREIIRAAQFAPVQARCKICLIANAEGLTTEAANALLKILEEPPRGLQFILLAGHPSDLLPTIVSRSRLIRVPIASVSQIAERLTEAAYSTGDAQWIAQLALRDGELDAFLASPGDVRKALSDMAAEFAAADLSTILEAALCDDAIRRRQALLAVLLRVAERDGELLTTGIRILSSQTRETIAQFLHDLLSVAFNLVRSADHPDLTSDGLAEQVLTAMSKRQMHQFCSALDEAHRSLVVYGPIEGILLSLFLTSEGEFHGS